MRVLVVYYGNKTTFIQRDIDILSKHFDVDEIDVRRIQDILDLMRKIRWSDIVFIWFAGKHAGISVFLSKLFRKKSIVVVGGYDVANVPEIRYGLWYKGGFLDRYLCKYSIKKADFVAPVSKFHETEMLKIAKPRRYRVIYNGVPPDFCDVYLEKEKIILTVAILKKDNIKRKGLNEFMEVAKSFSDYTFIIVGKPIDNTPEILRERAPDNVKILGYVEDSKLREIYAKSLIYMQLSAYESFGIAVVEAMQCGCIPVVTNRGALPEVVDDAGIIVEYGNVESIINGMKKALEWAKDKNKINRAIERAKKFSLTKREKKLVEIIREIYPE